MEQFKQYERVARFIVESGMDDAELYRKLEDVSVEQIGLLDRATKDMHDTQEGSALLEFLTIVKLEAAEFAVDCNRFNHWLERMETRMDMREEKTKPEGLL